jgi:hypothetical protein
MSRKARRLRRQREREAEKLREKEEKMIAPRPEDLPKTEHGKPIDYRKLLYPALVQVVPFLLRKAGMSWNWKYSIVSWMGVAIITLLLGILVFPSGYKRRHLWIALVVTASIFIGAVSTIFEYQKEHAPTDITSVAIASLSDAQIGEIKKLEDFISGKDEMNLREVFDFSTIIRINMHYALAYIGGKLTKEDQEEVDRNINGNEMITDSSRYWDPRSSKTNGMILMPGVVPGVVTTKKYNEAINTLKRFEQSALLPEEIRKRVGALRQTVADDMMLWLAVVNQKLAEDKRYILFQDDFQHGFGGKLNNAFADSFIPLEPKRDEIISEIRRYLGVH